MPEITRTEANDAIGDLIGPRVVPTRRAPAPIPFPRRSTTFEQISRSIAAEEERARAQRNLRLVEAQRDRQQRLDEREAIWKAATRQGFRRGQLAARLSAWAWGLVTGALLTSTVFMYVRGL